jgi:hypothetical protein
MYNIFVPSLSFKVVSPGTEEEDYEKLSQDNQRPPPESEALLPKPTCSVIWLEVGISYELW